jgi:tellurite methyltransferase
VELNSAAARLTGVEDPSPWLLACGDLLPARGRALDLACGPGSHALVLAAAGYEVTAIDRDASALAALEVQARANAVPVRTVAMDLEGEPPDLGEAAYDLIVVFRYLHRPLFPALRRALAPEGWLVYETFTRAQAARAHPKNPDFLLEAGELTRLLFPLAALRQYEGERDGSFLAGALVRWPAAIRSSKPGPPPSRPSL